MPVLVVHGLARAVAPGLATSYRSPHIWTYKRLIGLLDKGWESSNQEIT
ncbi:hypothetical protein SAMN05421878_11640 [Actinobaculum suis]|uniref:Uncharacterized protein n=1 Tax=Actinobaculum suis TaxID=1657 RepID=A0A1G7ECR7_9ACTO|nr:hypothetical protein SAMN05421878_11640 [Actinobaculum suis]VDG76525.1 Uncharacterised protein [Actinobaculum suis]